MINSVQVFTINLQGALKAEKIENVVSFFGRDNSGSFGILADHMRFMTCLSFGLARFRCKNQEEEYLALPSAILYFRDNQLTLNTWNYIRSKSYTEIANALTSELNVEAASIHSIKQTLNEFDEQVLKHLWELKRKGEL